MKNLLVILTIASILASCSEKKPKENVPATLVTDTSKAKKVKPILAYPVKNSDWEVGSADQINPVLNYYKEWDNNELSHVADLFADTVRLRIPEERDEIIVPNNAINAVLKDNRSMYKSTTNNIISAVSLYDRENKEDWVFVTTYSKWIETNGKRDSLLYHDEWRLKNGKINFLLSFQKVPSKAFLKKADPKK